MFFSYQRILTVFIVFAALRVNAQQDSVLSKLHFQSTHCLSINSMNLSDSVLIANNVGRLLREDYGLRPGQKVPVYISGFVYDQRTKEPIPFADLAIEGTKLKLQTDKRGSYLFDLNDVPDSIAPIILKAWEINFHSNQVQVERNVPSNTFYDIALPSVEVPYCPGADSAPKKSKKR